MILFSTRSSRSLAEKISAHHGACTIKQFSDGELFVRIDEDVHNKQVWVLASTQPPAENLLELIFLLDALQHAGAHINLFIPYFAYARQTATVPGQAHSAQRISALLQQCKLQKIIILHAHNDLLHNFLPFTNVIDTEFFCDLAQDYDAIVAPDHGASSWAQQIAAASNKELIVLTKTRTDHEQVHIDSVAGNVQSKSLLIIDDIISTGRTLLQAAHTLRAMGATKIAAAATHGIFAPNAREALETSLLDQVFITNSVANKSHGKIIVVNRSRFIAAQLE